MLTNRIIDIFITVTAWIVLPLQLITTFVLGILVTISFGLLLLPFSLIWIVLFWIPLLGISYCWQKIPFTKFIFSILGIPLAIIGDIYVSLIPSMGETESRVVKLLCCQTFPYTWDFHWIYVKRRSLDAQHELNIILNRVSKDVAIRQYLNV
jgi:hypothetical protein